MDNKRKLFLAIIGVLLIILCGILIGYFMYKFNIKLEEEKILTAQETYTNKLNEGYEEMKFPENLSTLYSDVTEVLQKEDMYLMAIYEGEEVTYLLKINEENELYYELYNSFGDVNPPAKIETDITNVKQVLYQSVGTAVGSEQIFILTENGDVYYKYNWLFENMLEIPKNLNDFQKLNQKYQYNEMKMYYYDLGCPSSPSYELIGVTNNIDSSIIYSAGGGEEIMSIYESNYINNRFENVYQTDSYTFGINKKGQFVEYDYDKSIYVSSNVDVIVKDIILTNVDLIFIDNNNYLFSFNGEEVKKINDLEVEYIVKKELNGSKVSIIIIFEDGSIKNYEVEQENIAKY